jgi:hypothetical protein
MKPFRRACTYIFSGRRHDVQSERVAVLAYGCERSVEQLLGANNAYSGEQSLEGTGAELRQIHLDCIKQPADLLLYRRQVLSDSLVSQTLVAFDSADDREEYVQLLHFLLELVWPVTRKCANLLHGLEDVEGVRRDLANTSHESYGFHGGWSPGEWPLASLVGWLSVLTNGEWRFALLT